MSTPLVTEQSVHAAADALKTAGKTVSLRAIRNRIGGGSYRDIKIHLKTWWAKEANTPSSAVGAAATAVEVEKQLRESAAKVEATYQRRLNAELARLREESENSSRVAAAQLDGAAEDISAFQDEVDDLNTQLTDVQAVLEAERRRAQSLANELNEERVQRSILVAVESSTQQRVSDLKDAEAALRSELAAEREATASLRDRERHLRDELEQARSAAGASQQQVAHLLAEVEASKTRQHEIEASSGAQLDAGRQELRETRAALIEAREQAARIQGELDGVRNRREELPAAMRPELPGATKGKPIAGGVKAVTS